MDWDLLKKNPLRTTLPKDLEEEFWRSRLLQFRRIGRLALCVGILATLVMMIFALHVNWFGPSTGNIIRAQGMMLGCMTFGLATTYVSFEWAMRLNRILFVFAWAMTYIFVTEIVILLPTDRIELSHGFFVLVCLLAYSTIKVSIPNIVLCVGGGSLIYLYTMWSNHHWTVDQFGQVSLHAFMANLGGFILVMFNARSERTQWWLEKKLDIEREQSDHLLKNILPEDIAIKLKTNSSRIADVYPDVTVGFADIVGFTPLASELAPHAVVGLLDDLFREIDKVVLEHGAEKIKMIGDAYMFSAGCPMNDPNHAVTAAKVALGILEVVAKFREESGFELHVRIGLSSGPVVAGVICEYKFSFDMWGDTVNTASRMESSGASDAIQISESTAKLVRDSFIISEPKYAYIKGKGEMNVYELICLRQGSAA